MTPDRICIIGHSHIAALLAGAQFLGDEHTFEFVSLHEIQKANPGRSLAWREGSNVVLSAPLKQELNKFIDCGSHFVLTVGGACHTVAGLAKHPQPFCFHTPWRTIEARDANIQLIPFETMVGVMQHLARFQLTLLEALIDYLTPSRSKVLETPPPIESDFETTRLARSSAPLIEKYGIQPAASRMDWWRLQSIVFKRVADRLGVETITPPNVTLTPSGFLKPEYCFDPAHGNTEYGREVLLHLRSSDALRTQA